MKVQSTVPFEFRSVTLAKGVSDFDVDKLNTSERAHFNDLVKAKVVDVLDGDAAMPNRQLTATDLVEAQKAFDDMQKEHDLKLSDLRAENERLRAQLASAANGGGFKGSPEPNSLPALNATASPYNQTPPAAADAIAKAGVEKANAAAADAASATTVTKSTAPAAATDPFLPTPPNAPIGATVPATTSTSTDDGKTKTSTKKA